MKGLIAKKVGMTQVFDESGNLTPVTEDRKRGRSKYGAKKPKA